VSVPFRLISTEDVEDHYGGVVPFGARAVGLWAHEKRFIAMYGRYADEQHSAWDPLIRLAARLLNRTWFYYYDERSGRRRLWFGR
jgi:hypothetical protein